MTESIEKAVEQLLAPKCEFVFLLGSYGTERFNDKSDIDIAAYFSNKIEFSELQNLRSQLESQFNRDVDLVALNDIDPIFARQVIESGRLVYCKKSGDQLTKWKVHQNSIYPDFKKSREGIEKSLLNRKKYV